MCRELYSTCRCGYQKGWELQDGRIKCRRCKVIRTPYSPWRASRLPDSVKQQLVRRYFKNLSVAEAAVGLCSRVAAQRFYCLIQETMAETAGNCEPFVRTMNYRSHGQIRICVPVELLLMDDAARARPYTGELPARLAAPGMPQRAPGNKYVVLVPIEEGLIVVENVKELQEACSRFTKAEQPASPGQRLLLFWAFTVECLSKLERVPQDKFHFYLGDATFRYSHEVDGWEGVLGGLMRKVG